MVKLQRLGLLCKYATKRQQSPCPCTQGALAFYQSIPQTCQSEIRRKHPIKLIKVYKMSISDRFSVKKYVWDAFEPLRLEGEQFIKNNRLLNWVHSLNYAL